MYSASRPPEALRRSRSALPTVLVGSVIRWSTEGDVHGRLYLVDLEAGTFEHAIDWDDPDIDWGGRGAGRGLRGIAVHGDHVIVAASLDIHILDRNLQRVDSIRNKYLRSVHEIFVDGDTLLVASTGIDSVLEYDLVSGEFTRGVSLIDEREGRLVIDPWEFDPRTDEGPDPCRPETLHLNMVSRRGDETYVCGTRFRSLAVLRGRDIEHHAVIRSGSHNAQPLGGGVVYNDTRGERVVVGDLDGTVRASFDAPQYSEDDLVMTDVGKEVARVAWARGLAVDGDLLIAGSSPANVAVHDIATGETLKVVTMTNNVCDAVHGLAIWPFS